MASTRTRPAGVPRVAWSPAAVAGGVGLLAAGLLLVRRLTRAISASAAETSAVLSGDELLPAAARCTTRAVSVGAPPEAVWPWLVQLGDGRAGWYSLDRVERLLGAGHVRNVRSAERIVPAWQDLAVGDPVPLSDRLDLEVAVLDPGRALVLVLPRGPLRFVWSFTLWPVAGGTRLVVRTRTAWNGAPALGPAALGVLDLGHLVMESVMLAGIRRRVEAAGR